MKPAHQSRSRKTRDKLLLALEQLLKQKEFTNISVAEIATEAGVSPASIYRRFDSKNGFIPVLFELYLKRLDEWAASDSARPNIDGQDLRGAIYILAETVWQQIRSQRHIMRAIISHGRQHTSLLEDHIHQYIQATLTSMHGLLSLYEGDIKRTDKKATAGMLAYYFNNIFIERGLFKDQTPDWGANLSDSAFVTEAAEFAYGYLITPPVTLKT